MTKIGVTFNFVIKWRCPIQNVSPQEGVSHFQSQNNERTFELPVIVCCGCRPHTAFSCSQLFTRTPLWSNIHVLWRNERLLGESHKISLWLELEKKKKSTTDSLQHSPSTSLAQTVGVGFRVASQKKKNKSHFWMSSNSHSYLKPTVAF